jgi:hypothetical protein
MAGPYIAGNIELVKTAYNEEIKNIVDKKQIMRALVTVDQSDAGIETFYQESTRELNGLSNTPREADFYMDNVVLDTLTKSPQKYTIESRIAYEDLRIAAMNLPVRTTFRVANWLLRQEDSMIYNTMSQNQTATTINTVATSASWDNAQRANRIPHEDVARAVNAIVNSQLQAYMPNALFVNPFEMAYLRTNDYVMSSWDASSPELMSKGAMGQFLGLDVIQHPLVVADSALVAATKQAVTLKDVGGGLNTYVEDRPGRYRVFGGWLYESAALTDPKASCLITNTRN